MNKIVPIIICGLVAIGGTLGAIAYHSFRPASSQNFGALKLPGGFQKLTPGMSESDVIAAVGPPQTKSVNRKVIHKSDADWANLQAQVDADNNSTSLSSATNPQATLRALQLEHRIKDTWRYSPSSHIYAILRFDDQRHLVRIDTGVAPQSPSSPK